ASLTGRIDITAPVEDLTKARIDARIEDALIETARSRLRSKGPMQFSVDEGRVTAQAVRFEGDNTFVRLTAGAASPYHLNLNLEGRLDVSLLKILTPFLEELRGQLNFSVQAKGPFRKPQFLGSASLRESLVKLRAFPHAFEQLN